MSGWDIFGYLVLGLFMYAAILSIKDWMKEHKRRVHNDKIIRDAYNRRQAEASAFAKRKAELLHTRRRNDIIKPTHAVVDTRLPEDHPEYKAFEGDHIYCEVKVSEFKSMGLNFYEIKEL